MILVDFGALVIMVDFGDFEDDAGF